MPIFCPRSQFLAGSSHAAAIFSKMQGTDHLLCAFWTTGFTARPPHIAAPTHKVVNLTRTRINYASVHAISLKSWAIDNKVGNLTILCRSRDRVDMVYPDISGIEQLGVL
jgi:hypothetical protein